MLDPRRSAFATVLLVGIVYAATLALVDARGFWIVDNAQRFLQLRAIVDSDYRDWSIPWPGAVLDPELTCQPIRGPFAHVEQGRIYSQYSPLFPLLSSGPFRLFGFRGLSVLPLLFTLLGLAALARLAPEHAHGAVLIAGLATPLWFYAVVFWEPAIAVGLMLWGLFWFARYLDRPRDRYLVGAGLLMSLATWFRLETIVLFAVATVMLVLRLDRSRLRAVAIASAAFAFGLMPWLVFHRATLGDPLGFHLRSNLTGLQDQLLSRPAVFYRLLAAAHESVPVSLSISAPFLIAMLWHRGVPRRGVPVLAAAAAITAGLSLAGYLSDPIHHLIRANSLFPAAPVVILALVRFDDPGGDRRLAWLRSVTIAYAVVYCMLAPNLTSTGIHWGNRFLLVVYPLLALLAAVHIGRWWGSASWPSRVPVGLVLLVSLAAQGYSIHLLRERKEFSARVNSELSRYDEPAIVTDTWWVPQELHSAFYEKPIFFVDSDERLRSLEVRLVRAGIRDYLFVTTLANAAPGAAIVDDGPLGFFSLGLDRRAHRAH